MNRKIRVLLADDNAQLRERINNALCAREEVECCHCASGGGQALTLLREREYDVLVTDLILPQVDGFSVLETVHAMSKPPRIIVLTALSQDDIIRRACALGVYYYIIKPFDVEALCRRVIECAGVPSASGPEQVIRVPVSAPAAPAPIKSLDERIANVFLAVGIPAHIKGYHFLREAVKQVYARRSMINAITKELYPSVAAAFETTPSKVERAIRHAIEVAWARGKIENINDIFGYTIYSKQEKPTNGEFIALVADKLLMDDLTRSEQQAHAG